MQKPSIIRQIEEQLNITLHTAPSLPTPLRGLMIFQKNRPKYLADEQGQLIGLNLAATELDDARWQQIIALLEKHSVQLQALNLCENRLQNFISPPGIAAMSDLDLDDNPLEFPLPEIVKQGQAAVLRFLQDAAAQGTREAFEVKMLIVGEGGAGKTTLWNLLQNPDYEVLKKDQSDKEREDPTLGINIKEGWKFNHLDQPNVPFLVNLWDFGGQEIQYMTHQFFLTRRSFYVLLADGRSESPNFPYWLNIINILGRKEDEKLPVLVVLNEKGNRMPTPPYEPEEVKRQYPDLELVRIDVDFKEKGKRLEVLNEEIRTLLCRRIAHLPLVIPNSWEEVRKEIRILRESVNHINQKEFAEICTRHGIADSQRQDDLSRSLHDLGFILHFHDVKLKDFIVLNPNWAVNAVYTILKYQDVRDFSQGRLNEVLLQKIWTEKGLSADEQANMINLMTKDGLEVCFEADDSNREKIYIAPQLLPEKAPPSLDVGWIDSPETLRYIYDYNFMPKGIITRLIVRLHKYIEACEEENASCPLCQKLVWKNGAYLRKNGCRARVCLVSDWQRRRERIEIEVQGVQADDRKYVLRDIRDELDEIHSRSFPTLRVAEKIPCCCDECRNSQEPWEHDRNGLEDRKKKNHGTAECGKSYKPVSVQQLLNGVFQEREFSPEPKQQESNPPVTVNVYANQQTEPSGKSESPAKKPWWKRWKIISAISLLLAGLAWLMNLLGSFSDFTGLQWKDLWMIFSPNQ